MLVILGIFRVKLYGPAQKKGKIEMQKRLKIEEYFILAFSDSYSINLNAKLPINREALASGI